MSEWDDRDRVYGKKGKPRAERGRRDESRDRDREGYRPRSPRGRRDDLVASGRKARDSADDSHSSYRRSPHSKRPRSRSLSVDRHHKKKSRHERDISPVDVRRDVTKDYSQRHRHRHDRSRSPRRPSLLGEEDRERSPAKKYGADTRDQVEYKSSRPSRPRSRTPPDRRERRPERRRSLSFDDRPAPSDIPNKSERSLSPLNPTKSSGRRSSPPSKRDIHKRSPSEDYPAPRQNDRRLSADSRQYRDDRLPPRTNFGEADSTHRSNRDERVNSARSRQASPSSHHPQPPSRIEQHPNSRGVSPPRQPRGRQVTPPVPRAKSPINKSRDSQRDDREIPHEETLGWGPMSPREAARLGIPSHPAPRFDNEENNRAAREEDSKSDFAGRGPRGNAAYSSHSRQGSQPRQTDANQSRSPYVSAQISPRANSPYGGGRGNWSGHHGQQGYAPNYSILHLKSFLPKGHAQVSFRVPNRYQGKHHRYRGGPHPLQGRPHRYEVISNRFCGKPHRYQGRVREKDQRIQNQRNARSKSDHWQVADSDDVDSGAKAPGPPFYDETNSFSHGFPQCLHLLDVGEKPCVDHGYSKYKYEFDADKNSGSMRQHSASNQQYRQGSHPPSGPQAQYVYQQTQSGHARGGGHAGASNQTYPVGPRGRGGAHFSNLSWSASNPRGRGRGGSFEQQSGTPHSHSNGDYPGQHMKDEESEDLFRPSKEFRAEDESAQKFKQADSSPRASVAPSDSGTVASALGPSHDSNPPGQADSSSQAESGSKFSFAFKAKSNVAVKPEIAAKTAQRLDLSASKPAAKPEVSHKSQEKDDRRDNRPLGPRLGNDPNSRRRDIRDDRGRRDYDGRGGRDNRDSRYRDFREDRDHRDSRDSRGGREHNYGKPSRGGRRSSPPKSSRRDRSVERQSAKNPEKMGIPTGPKKDRDAKAASQHLAVPASIPIPKVKKREIILKIAGQQSVLSKLLGHMSIDWIQSKSVYYRKPGNEGVVGSGTYGKVYKAVHVYTKDMVALKKIRMEGERDGFPVTATREIKILQKLKNENIVDLREMMVEKNDAYMVFEYCAHDLAGLINHPTFRLNPSQTKDLARQMFAGLGYLHDIGILHRDIKAANILVTNEGQLKLADFGLARFYDKHRKGDYTNRVVTIWFRSPELILGETEYGPAVDIWSAACIFMEMFTKAPIFQGDGTELSQFDKICMIMGTPTHEVWQKWKDMLWFELFYPQFYDAPQFETLYKE
jgi:CTD kinase subunit alpha